MYKLISLDLDGTLFNSNGQISERNMAAIDICHNHGLETVIATGRPPRFTFRRVPDHLTEGYCICYNGARIYYNQELLQEFCIKASEVKAILDFSDQFKVALEVNDSIYSNFDVSDYWPNTPHQKISDIECLDKVCKILIINSDDFPYEQLEKQYSSHCNIIKTDQDRLIEVMHKEVTKCEAVYWISKRMGISLKEVVAFGDDHNDLEILSSVGLGVAMMNSNDKVKSVATSITASNDDDGVALVLEKLIEGNYE